MDPNATNSSPADSSSAGGADVPDEDFDTYVSRMDGGTGDTSTRAPAAQGTAQDQGQNQDDQGAAQGQGQGDNGKDGQGQGDNGKDGQGQGDGKDRRPWKRIIAATAAARNSAAAQKVAELEAENARLRALAGGQPAQAAAPVAQAQAQAQAPGAKPRPREEDFVKPDGTFDGAAYLDARDEWRDSERERVERERSEQQTQERTQAEEMEHAQKVGATFWGKVNAMTAEIPDARETLEGMASPEIASRIPPRVQIALLEADPLVTYAIAHREDLLGAVMSGNVENSLRLVGHLEGLLAQYQNQRGGDGAGAGADAGQTAAQPVLMAQPGAQPGRSSSGQFVAAMPAAPPRQQPRAPVDLGGGGSRPANPLDGDDFEAAADFLDRKNRRR